MSLSGYSDGSEAEDGRSGDESSMEPPSFSAIKSEKRWRASPSPTEDFSGAKGADANNEWPFDIIGEEVDHNGDIKYEVRWGSWTRPDGSRTTWATNKEMTPKWDKDQLKRRRSKAQDILEIDVVATTDIHNSSTFLRSQAYEEKLKLCSSREPNRIHEMARLMAKHEGHIRSSASFLQHGSSRGSSSSTQLRTSQRTSVLSSSRLSSRSSVTSESGRNAFSHLPAVSAANTPSSKPSLSSKAKGKRRAVSDSTDELSLRPSSSAASSSHLSDWPDEEPAPSRMKLQQQWTRFAKKAGAAPIVFVNDVDDESTPPLHPSFTYLEAEYNFSPDVEPPPDEGFLMMCECKSCENADLCGCQGVSELQDETGSKTFAYTDSGLFAFNVLKGTEVIECNKLCYCTPSSCLNRVSQKPRDVPIEIFKTKKRGWGARSLKPVKRGKVLGMYTGLIIPRDSYISLPEDQSEYCFDLDGDELLADTEDDVMHKKYSVDSMRQGNWTRFINHSCSPNLQIYLAVHDIPPGTGMPFIVFVATQNIPARTEFTLDYDPKVGEEMALAKSRWKGKGKWKAPPVPLGSKPCLCESPDCRGYMT